MASTVKGLVERLRDGENVICAEGYLWELERRGYLRSGVFTPEVVMDHPERVRNLHEEFVHAGSDVVEAFTYYGHRAKLRMIGREDELEALNLAALKIARDVADKTGTLMAGNLSNTTIYDPGNSESVEEVKSIFKEQVEWAVKGRADYFIAETFDSCSEASLALEAVRKYGKGLPAVITMAAYVPDRTTDDVPFPQALRRLEEEGAAVVGLNCGRGPATMLPLLRQIRQSCKGPIAALPVTFRTTPQQKCFQCLTDPVTGGKAFPTELAPLQCTRAEIRQFATEARELGVQYIGLCCGSASYYLREVAIAYGRNPPAAKYKPDLERSLFVGDVEVFSRGDRISKLRSFVTGDIQS
ncbi:betaine--homocysteine S-methyltransferase 1-like [Haliotis rufescens]|uniref:betaine--homocysteine S-methyltransferase 1-like n=1 Tax=Haliotis rufescens TaxID=6454 RepID=UPI00201ED7F4|nr:betaine--homocysteine S-methyltransferase 1-like [Haliotis rufescens]